MPSHYPAPGAVEASGQKEGSAEFALLQRIDAYLDAVPRSNADTIDLGPLTLFVSRSVWPYYARPTRETNSSIRVEDVHRAIEAARQNAMEPSIEWVHELHPSLAHTARTAGMSVTLHPLLVFDPAASRAALQPDGYRVRVPTVGDPGVAHDVAMAHAVTQIAFTDFHPQPIPDAENSPPLSDREAADRIASADPAGHAAHLLSRLTEGRTDLVIAEDDRGTVAAGSIQPVASIVDRDGVTFSAAEVTGIGTLPSARRKGLGTAITAALTEVARARGCDLIFLSAADEATAEIYRRVGYRDVGRAGAAAMPSADDIPADLVDET